MLITVASGKGGTGKTTFSCSLAEYLSREHDIEFFDCDVEAPNSHIFLKPEIRETESVNLLIPEVDMSGCTLCGKCSDFCRYNALAVIKKTEKVLIFNELCHGCGGCFYVCPENAITEKERPVGRIRRGPSGGGRISFAGGELEAGEMSGVPVINKMKDYMKSDRLNIIDAPPGNGCAATAAIADTDFLILVTEPTPFGLYDLELTVKLAESMNKEFAIVINKVFEEDNIITEYCRRNDFDCLGSISFDKAIAEKYSAGETPGIPEMKKITDNLKEKLL